jgi:hypothetical protein
MTFDIYVRSDVITTERATGLLANRMYLEQAASIVSGLARPTEARTTEQLERLRPQEGLTFPVEGHTWVHAVRRT